MDEESKPLTVFTVEPLGFYECDRMPFTQTNTPATFQQLMETCLRDLNLNWCIIYPNDIVIFLKDPTNHLVRLEAMFQKLEQARLKLKPSKCKLFCRQVTYLGCIVSALGVSTNKEKISYQKMVNPTTVTEVWIILGFTGYYCWFIPEFVQIAQPLHELTSGENTGKKRAAITWDEIPEVLWWTEVPMYHSTCFGLYQLLQALQAAHWCLWVWSGVCHLPDLWWWDWCYHLLCMQELDQGWDPLPTN